MTSHANVSLVIVPKTIVDITMCQLLSEKDKLLAGFARTRYLVAAAAHLKFFLRSSLNNIELYSAAVTQIAKSKYEYYKGIISMSSSFLLFTVYLPRRSHSFDQSFEQYRS